MLSALAAALTLACSRAPDQPTAAPAAAAPAQRPARMGAVGDDFVTAVSAGRPGAPIELKFALRKRPEVGEPLEIHFAVVPVVPLDRVIASFQAGDGLELRAGNQMPRLERPLAGEPVSHVVTIVPKRDGIFHLTAVILAESATSSIARTFTIPIIAGAGIAESIPGAAAAASADPAGAMR